MHIETVNLADGDYELVSADSRVDQEVILNCTNLSQDLGQAPEAFLPDSALRRQAPEHNPTIFRVLILLSIYNVL